MSPCFTNLESSICSPSSVVTCTGVKPENDTAVVYHDFLADNICEIHQPLVFVILKKLPDDKGLVLWNSIASADAKHAKKIKKHWVFFSLQQLPCSV